MKTIQLPDFITAGNPAATAKTIFDPVRKKSVVATPEERVRQAILHYLISEKNFPRALLAVEVSLTVNRLRKRCDILAYKDSKPVLLVECKAPSVKITQGVFDQIARYNLALQVPYLFVTNGVTGFCCKVDLKEKKWKTLDEVPAYHFIQ